MVTTRIPGVSSGLRPGGFGEGLLTRVEAPMVSSPAGTSLHDAGGHTINLGSAEWLMGPGKKTFAKAVVLDGAGEVKDIHSLKGFQGDHFWAYAPFGIHTMITGHYYLALNRVGHFPAYTVKQAVDLLGANINDLFPWDGASNGTGAPLKVGNRLHLTFLRRLSVVEVTYTCAPFFILRTRFFHPLVGIAIHGLFHDSVSDELWMFQEGFGYPMSRGKAWLYALSPGYGLMDQLRGTSLNYDPARDMWESFAVKVRNFLSKQPPKIS